jgi:hypothetical protein
MKPIGLSNCAIEIIFHLMMAGLYEPEPMPACWGGSPRDLYRRPMDNSPGFQGRKSSQSRR